MKTTTIVVFAVLCILAACGCGKPQSNPPAPSEKTTQPAPAATQPGATAAAQPAATAATQPAAPPPTAILPGLPPVVYDQRLDPKPLTDAQLSQIVGFTIGHLPRGLRIWYVHVHFNNVSGGNERWHVSVFFAPESTGPRVRKGRYFHLRDRMFLDAAKRPLPTPEELARQYVQVSLADKPFGKSLELPAERLWPFAAPEGFTDDELVEIVDFARTSPHIPVPPATMDANGVVTAYVRGSSFDGNEPIYLIRRLEDGTIKVKSGAQQDWLAGSGSVMTCVKKDGKWVVLSAGSWVS